MAPPSLRSGPDASSSVLLEDAVYEILLCVPAKDLCRFRAVCRSWRSLLFDPHFVAAHAAAHLEPPLIVVCYQVSQWSHRILYDIMDLSGRVVKRVHATEEDGSEPEWVVCAQPDLVCVAKDGSGMRCQLLNLATGVVHALSEGLAAEHATHNQDFLDCFGSCAFGLVPSTGEYKVLREVEVFSGDYASPTKLYEVFTLDGSRQARWRAKQAPPYDVELDNRRYCLVTNGIVYFLFPDYGIPYDANKALLASFDLETEKCCCSQWLFSSLLSCIFIPYNYAFTPNGHMVSERL